MIIDIRHPASDKDRQMYEWIVTNTGFEPIIIATKLDKIKKREVDYNVRIIRESIGASDDCTIIPFSAEDKEGVKDFLKIIEDLI